MTLTSAMPPRTTKGITPRMTTVSNQEKRKAMMRASTKPNMDSNSVPRRVPVAWRER